MIKNNLIVLTALCGIFSVTQAQQYASKYWREALINVQNDPSLEKKQAVKAALNNVPERWMPTAVNIAKSLGITNLTAYMASIDSDIAAARPVRRRPAAPATTATTSPSTTATMPATTTTPAATSATATVTPPAIIPTAPTMGAAPTTPPSAPPLPTSGPRPVVYKRSSDAGTTPPPVIKPSFVPADADDTTGGIPDAPGLTSGMSYSPTTFQKGSRAPNAPAMGYTPDTRNTIVRIGNAIDFAQKIGRKYPTGSRNADFQDAIDGLDDAEKTLNSISLVLTKEDNTKLRAELSDAKKLLGSSAKYQTTGDQLATDLPALQKAIKDGFYQAQPGTFGAANTKAALAKYEDAMELYNKVHFNIKDEQQKQLQESINNLKALIDIQSAIDAANASWKDRNAHDARLNYTKALNLLQSTGSGLDASIQDQLNKQLNKIKADSRIGIDSTTTSTPPPVPPKPTATSSDTYDSLTRELKDAPVVIPTELKERAEAFLNANRSSLTAEQIKRFKGHLGE